MPAAGERSEITVGLPAELLLLCFLFIAARGLLHVHGAKGLGARRGWLHVAASPCLWPGRPSREEAVQMKSKSQSSEKSQVFVFDVD